MAPHIPVGPDGRFLFGTKMYPQDRGGLNASVRAFPPRHIVMDFGTELDWAACTVTEARGIAKTLRALVTKHWGKLGYRVGELPITVKADIDKHIVQIYFHRRVGVLVANPEVYLALAQRLDEAADAMR
jgi:hypothetical protein